jgi:predicted enzyme related to lactoylglutathione lyase
MAVDLKSGGRGAAAQLDYVELPTATAHELTRAFYAKALGWTFTDYGPDYSAAGTGASELGLNGDRADALSAPLPLIRTDAIEVLFDAVVAAGGVISRPIFPFPGGRRFQFIDPSGSELGVYQPDSDEA